MLIKFRKNYIFDPEEILCIIVKDNRVQVFMKTWTPDRYLEITSKEESAEEIAHELAKKIKAVLKHQKGGNR